MKLTATLLTALLIASVAFATDSKDAFIENTEVQTPYASFVFNLNHSSLQAQLASTTNDLAEGTRDNTTIALPLPNGETATLEAVYAPIMEAGLANRYPEIKSYKVSGEGINGRIGYTYKGFHGMLFTERGTVYIDAVSAEENIYTSYYRKDYTNHFRGSKEHRCLLDESMAKELDYSSLKNRGGRSGEQLRTYRLALACTGEYAQFHGGTVSGALSAMVVTMNRVNGVYERDVSLTMVIIANNDDLIFLDENNDPYTNNSGGTMLSENQSTVNSVIGSGNYDIGHVFSTGGGGIASLGSVCGSSKAQGVTGGSSPTGDAFDIDFVAHEIGHQFGGQHTFNSVTSSCGGGNREGSSAFEPGSGSTIMAYAGICGSDNIQGSSDDYFHTHSLDQIIAFSQFANGNSCATVTNTGNNAPVVDAGVGGFTIPKETPFLLVGSATDANGDNLTYTWEQMDLGSGGSPDSPVGEAPIFRSWDPTDIPERTCPRAVNIVIGNTVFGETYATYSRELNFRLTARDENTAGGGVGSDELTFDVDGLIGPFVVTSPLASEQVEASNGYAITWDVAGTNAAPVNCQTVAIDLCSFSAGSFVLIETLNASTANDGSEIVNISESSVGGGRYIRVRATDNIFFNINAGQFSVTEPSEPDDAGIPLTATLDEPNMLVQLNWIDSFSNESWFMIERSIGNNQNFILIDSVPTDVTTYDDVNAELYGMNYYRIRAKNAGGLSQYSNEATYQGVGIQQLNNGNISIYPNPANEYLVAEFDDVSEIESLQVVNASGQPVRILNVRSISGSQRIDLDGLASGQYWLSVTTKSATVSVTPFQIAK